MLDRNWPGGFPCNALEEEPWLFSLHFFLLGTLVPHEAASEQDELVVMLYKVVWKFMKLILVSIILNFTSSNFS